MKKLLAALAVTTALLAPSVAMARTVTISGQMATYQGRAAYFAIYVTDAERDHSFSHAASVYVSLLRLYTRCGYLINEVPCVPVEQRVSHVLQALANDA